ncbi:hypothetical protein [Streptomyces sp. DfronAA-171]|nr:hypothetical protein [Streptomyces sp. DfronAA-171]SCE50196.1 hypothetical protein GA0115252_15497 [Streptomyces sp. DfronAA-171]
MPRPSDWSALGLGGDPTPGDADRIDEVISSQENLVSLADTIDDGLTSVLNTTDGIFVGETADALRKKIDGDLRKYVSSFRQAHKDVQGALRTYVDVMRTQQKRADDALTAAAALDEDDDAGREEQKGIAEDAKSQLKAAASTASDTITDAAYSIASPIDECEEFWKALGWLALILIIPAMIVGGPLALFAIGLNVALLIKTAIDFSQGKASITDLVLSIIGVIAPTTKGIRLGDLWKGLKGLGAGAFKGAGNLFSGANSLGSLTRLTLGFDDVFAASGNWLRGLKGLNGLKISGAGLHFMPGAKGFTMGINGIRDIKLVPAVSGLTVINLAGAKTFFAMKTVIGGLNGIRALGTTLVNTTVNGLRGANSLRLLLPVAADELGHGVLFALKIGVIDRGVFGLYRYGAFAGGQFIGAASKISGGVAHGLQLAPPTGGFGSFAHVNLSGFTPTPPTGIGGGLTSVHGLTGGSAIGGINTSAFHGLGSTINSSVPALGAKVVDVPSISTLSGVSAVHIPTLGPMNAVSAPGIGATHIPGGVTDVGQVAAHGVDVPHLGAGVGRVDTPALGGLGQVHTPQLGSVAVPAPTQGHIAAPGQINAPAVHQVNVPSLGSVSQGSVVGKLDAPPVGARVSDLPSVNVGVTHVNLPTAGHVSVPALGNGTEVSLPSVGRVDIAAVGRGTEINAPTVSRVEVPSASASAPVTAPPVGHVDIPAVGATSASAPPVAHVDAPAVRTGDTAVPPAAQVHSPTVHQPGQTQVQAPATSGHVTAVPGGGQVTVPPLSSGAGAGDGANGLGHLNGSVTGIDAKPTPMPATTGGLALPGSGSLIADLGKGGLVDLSALAQRTIRVNMVHTVQYDLQHTFRNMDELLPGVVVDVRPGTGATRADVTVTQTGGLSGVTAHHLQQGGRDILRIERTLGDGTVHRWNYYLDASTDYAPAGPMEIVPPGTRGSGDVELTSLPGGSHHPPAASTSAAVSVPAPAPLTRTLDVPGLNGVQLHVTPDGTGGIGHAAVTVQPGGGAWTATVRAGHTPGTPGIVHMEQRVSAVEVRHMDVSPQDGGGLRVLSDERFVTLSGGQFHGAVVALDSLAPNTVRHVPAPGAATPGGVPGMVGHEIRMPSGSGFQLYDPATGLPTRSGLRLGDGAGGEIHVLPSRNGQQLGLTGPDGAPAPAPQAQVTAQAGGGFRVQYGESHVVVDATGARTHTVVPLGGTNDFVLTPAGGGGHTLVDAAGAAHARPVTAHGTDFHVPDGTNPRLTHVYDAHGAPTHDLLSLQHPGFAGRDVHLPTDGTPPTLHGATVTPQTGGGFRIDDPTNGHHIVVGPQGAHTHNAIPLGTTGDLALRPTGPGPVTRVDLNGGARGPVTVHGTNFHVPDGTNPHLTHVYDGAGTHTHDLLALHGHPHLNGPLRTDPAGGNPTLGAGDTVVRQGDGSFRVQAGGNHAVFDGQGAHTHDVVRLGTGNEYAHMPVGGGAPRVVDAGGTPVPHATVVTRPDGHILVTGTGGRVLYRPDGTVQAQVGHVLANGEGIRVHPGGHLALYSRDMNPVDDVTVTARPGGGHRITGADGQVRLFGPAGAHDYTIAPPGAGAHTFRVTDHAGGGHFDVVQLTDGVGTRFVRTDTHVLLDGDMAPVPAGTHTFAHQADGNYRLTFNGGGRANEYHLYNGNGQLFEQRINVFDKGTLKNDQFLKVTHPTDGVTKPSWERVRLDGTGQPVAAPAIKKWYDAGTVDTKGLGNGRVKLTTHSGVELMERRPLPNGHVLDGYHSAAGVGSFGRFNQRGVWTEFDGAGTVVGSGTRHWGESGRSWFDVTGHTGTRVRHYQELPDGGHVLADVGHRPFSQSFSGDTRWTRFDSEFKKVAEGDRTWGPGRGFTDHLPHPETGVRVVAQEKFGRFNWSVDDVRRLHQTEFGADGVPKKDYTSWSAHGKENGRGVTLKDGGFLDSTRFAEQRPPRVFRWMMSPEYRAANLDHVPWLAKDGRLQMHTWTETGAGGVTHGVRFVSNNGTITDISRAGDLVRETRKPLDGKAVTTGDVAMPDGVAKQNGYLPWKQGDDGLKGHRTYQATDFDTTNLPTGVNAGDIRWQERFTNDLGDGNWYTPNAGKQWHVARMGLADGSVVDFRPPPGAAGREGRMGAGSDWTRYDHHGLVISRQDTFPDPAGGANGIRITSQGMLDGTVRWSDGAGGGGVRRLNHHRGEVTPWGWDRESFQDFDAAGALVRDHRLLADGTVVDAWKTPQGGWSWNKTGADGAVKGFGGGAGDRVRLWFGSDGRPLGDFRPGAVFKDFDLSSGHVVQEIPVRPADTPHFQDSPYRVREHLQSPGDTFDAHVWKEYDNGIELGRKVRLPDGSFLESEDWHKQWRRFGADGASVIDERTIPGYVWHRDTFGRTTLTGRETNFTGILSEYRGFNRMWREPNRWEWGHTASGVSTYTSFPYKAGQALAVDLIQEFLLDFGMNLAVYGIVAAATGTPFGWNEVGKAAFGAAVGAGVKGAFSAGHFATFRGGPWKTGLSQVDQGNPYARRPNDDSWTAEFAGNEKVTRWRSGTYDWGVGLMTGAVSGFVTAAASSAIFGIKDANGNTVHLHGSDALLAGAVGMAGGVAGAVSLGVARTAMIQNFGGRFYHRGGVFDTFAVAGLGKLVDKTFANLYLSSTLQKQVFPGHDFYTGEQQNEQNGEPK